MYDKGCGNHLYYGSRGDHVFLQNEDQLFLDTLRTFSFHADGAGAATHDSLSSLFYPHPRDSVFLLENACVLLYHLRGIYDTLTVSAFSSHRAPCGLSLSGVAFFEYVTQKPPVQIGGLCSPDQTPPEGDF